MHKYKLLEDSKLRTLVKKLFDNEELMVRFEYDPTAFMEQEGLSPTTLPPEILDKLQSVEGSKEGNIGKLL